MMPRLQLLSSGFVSVEKIVAAFEHNLLLLRAAALLINHCGSCRLWASSVERFSVEGTLPIRSSCRAVTAAGAGRDSLADIATRATEVSALIAGFGASAVPNPQIETIRKALPELSQRFDGHLAATTKALNEEPTLETLQTQQQQWQNEQLQPTAWLNALTLEATKLQSALNHLAESLKTWEVTRASAQAEKARIPLCRRSMLRWRRLPLRKRRCRRNAPACSIYRAASPRK